MASGVELFRRVPLLGAVTAFGVGGGQWEADGWDGASVVVIGGRVEVKVWECLWELGVGSAVGQGASHRHRFV